MPLFIRDLTDLLKGMVDTEYWFIKRWHEGVWYYLNSYHHGKCVATWTRSKEKAISYAYEKPANQLANILSQHCGSIELSREGVNSDG